MCFTLFDNKLKKRLKNKCYFIPGSSYISLYNGTILYYISIICDIPYVTYMVFTGTKLAECEKASCARLCDERPQEVASVGDFWGRVQQG